MCPVMVCDEIRIPPTVVDLDSFRRWVYTNDLPETVRVAFLQGDVWIDPMPERIQSHGQVKGEISRVLSTLTKTEDLGRWFPDRTWWTNLRGNVSTESDGLFLSWDTLEMGRARFVGEPGQAIEIEGSPDMTLEVVSGTSVQKDTVVLMKGYWQAGVREYWLVDARGKKLDFRIFTPRPRGFRAVPERGGWVRSSVFGKEFKLERRRGRLQLDEYELMVR